MRSILGRFTLALCILQISISIVSAQSKSEPLSDRELMALVAGNSLSENVAHEMESRGLNFRTCTRYRSLLSEAGGDARVLNALKNVTASGVSGTESNDLSAELVMHLSNEGQLMRNKQYEEAGKELTFALGNGGGPETGYVMGELLRIQEKNQESAYVYTEVLRRSPDPTGEANVLHLLGRSAEAAKMEERMKSIQAGSGQMEGAVLAPQR